MTDYTISVAGLSAGAHSANTLSADLTNPACTVVANATWTPLSTKYLAANDNTDYVVKSIGAHDTRDMEVTTWVRSGYVFLRLDSNGKGIYFFHNGESTNGTLDIGITTGLTESAYPSGTQYVLYRNTDLVGSVSGYDKTDTTGDAFTFGVSGFDIYVEFNGVEFCRFKEYRHMEVGGVAIKTNVAGFRDITHTTLSTATLLSDYTNRKITMSDWGARALQTTGSISASSTSLTVASSVGFQIGDWVCVEIGNEAGAGLRGTIGVGGVWPAAHQATLAALVATTPAVNTFAWQEDTGEVWRYWNVDVTISNANPGVVTIASNILSTNGKVTFKAGSGTLPSQIVAGTTYYVIDAGQTATTFEVSATLGGAAINTSGGSGTVKLNWVKTNPYAAVNYYPNLALPRSLRARVTAIPDGTHLTLDTAATASTTSASVYLDNQLYFNDLLQTPRTDPSNLTAIAWPSMALVIPAGNFYLGGEWYTSNRADITIQGAGQSSTFLLSPKGMRGWGLFSQNSDRLLVKDFTARGNVGLNYYGLNYIFDTRVPTPGGSQYAASGLITSVGSDDGAVDEDTFDANWIYSGVHTQQGDDIIVQDIAVYNVFTNAVAFNQSDNCWGYGCYARVEESHQSYTQWMFNCSTLQTNSGFVDCTIDNVYLGPGYESFASTGTQFIRCVGNNCSFSLNNAGDWLMRNCAMAVSANSISPSWAITVPLVAITTNTGSDLVDSGGRIENITMFADYINDDNDIPVGIIVNAFNPNITIVGGSYTAPNYAAPSTLMGPQGIRSTGTNTQVSCFTCYGTIRSGTPDAEQANIGIVNGSISYSRAGSIYPLASGGGVTLTGNGLTTDPQNSICLSSGSRTFHCRFV